MSFDVILPFLRPIAHLIQDPDVAEVMVNASRRVFIERQGQLEEVSGIVLDERNLKVAVKNIARRSARMSPKGVRSSTRACRMVRAWQPCFHRAVVGGTTLTISKFQTHFFTGEELVRIGTLTQEVLVQLRAIIGGRQNILVSGGTSTGKTTLLNALSAYIPDNERTEVRLSTVSLRWPPLPPAWPFRVKSRMTRHNAILRVPLVTRCQS